jgi:predicted KAP-like P-loop ATPase
MWSDNETTEDLLGFKVHADLIIDVIKDDQVLPVTIGVFGDWGSGKSSIMKIIQEELNKLEDGTFVLYFNGWVFEGYDDAKAALLESIVKAFVNNEELGSKIKNQTQKLLKSVKWMRVLGFSFKNIVLPTATAYFTGGLSLIPFLAQNLSKVDAKDLVEKLKGEKAEEYLKSFITEKDQSDEAILVREFRDDFAAMIKESKIKKLVVLIDDLDRCTPDRIIENLEAIKLFLNVEKTAFVIGADPRIVKNAIEIKYNTKIENSNDRIIEDYLEKLIQIPYHLPKLSDSEVETYLTLLICKRYFSNESFSDVLKYFYHFRQNNRYSVFGFGNIKSVVAKENIDPLLSDLGMIPTLSTIISQSLYGNPRQIKRFLNTFMLRKRLADVAKLDKFDNALLAKLMVLEYSEILLFNSIFEWQLTQEGIPKEIKELENYVKDKSCAEVLKDWDIPKYSQWKKDKIVKWLSTEPLLQERDLRDYFWIARDKLTSVVPGSSLIPPIVRAAFDEINQDLPKSVVELIIEEKVLPFNSNEQKAFLEITKNNLIKNSKNENLYQVFSCLIEKNIEDATEYLISALQKISDKSLAASFGSIFSTYKDHPILGSFLNKYLEKGNSPAANAFKLDQN